jgi:hypothetical protein
MFSGAKKLKVVFFQCDWFDPINDTRVEKFSMVEVKYEVLFRERSFVCTSYATGVLPKLSSPKL